MIVIKNKHFFVPTNQKPKTENKTEKICQDITKKRVRKSTFWNNSIFCLYTERGNVMKRAGVIAKCLMMITQVTITLGAPIVLCTAIGVWLDSRFGWYSTIPLLILGVLAGGRSAYVLVLQTLKETEKESTYDR